MAITASTTAATATTATFTGATFTGATTSVAVATGATFTGATFTGATFTGATTSVAVATSATTARYPSLAGRRVFISGGSSGIGAELVRAFAGQGAQVAFCGTRPDGGQALADELASAGLPAPWYAACDVRDILAYQALLARLIAETGPVQVLVNNAGRDDRHRMEDVTPAYWDDRRALNLKHYFFAIQSVTPGMAAAGGGSIINMGSVSWMSGRPGLVG